MAIQISGTTVINNSRKGIFQSANIGSYANPARPTGASTGDLIYSTTDNQVQVWNGSAWVAVGSGQLISASGGNAVSPAPGGFVNHIFTSPGTFTLTSASAVVEYLIVAGGGGGGNRIAPPYIPIAWTAGGGGGGGVLRGTATITGPATYSVTVGAGGAAQTTPPVHSSNGTPSTFTRPAPLGGTLTAVGGGGGGGDYFGPAPVAEPFRLGNPGGSAGGGMWYQVSIPSIPGTPTYVYQSGTLGQGHGSRASNYVPFGPPSIYPFGSAGGGAGCIGGSAAPVQNQFATSVGPYRAQGVYVNWGIPPSYGDVDPAGRTYFGGGGAMLKGDSFSYGGGGYQVLPESFSGVDGPQKNAVATTGGGGGSSLQGYYGGPAGTAGSGGSGIVIVRYALVQA